LRGGVGHKDFQYEWDPLERAGGVSDLPANQAQR